MESSEMVEKVAAALVLACGELENVVAEKVNPHFRSKYASLPAMLDSVRPVLEKHGLAVIQLPVNEGASIGVETVLLHASGQYLSQRFLVTPQKSDPQGAGSALTYCRRYALAAALGIGQDDDDANHASRPAPAPAPKAAPAAKAKPAPASAALNDALRAVDPDSSLAEVWPPDWLGLKLGFGKHAERTWAEMSEGGLDSGRAEYLRWMLKQNTSTEGARVNAARARLVLAYIEREIPTGLSMSPPDDAAEEVPF